MYFAYVKQRGEGCDYSIACGYELVDLGCETRIEAEAKFQTLLRQRFNGDTALESATLFDMNDSFEVDISINYKEIEMLEKQAEAQHEEEEEVKLLRLLMKKHGNKITKEELDHHPDDCACGMCKAIEKIREEEAEEASSS